LPESDYSNEILEKAKVIITTHGEEIKNFATDSYRKLKNQNSGYAKYDTTRRVELQLRLVKYKNGKLLETDCCN
jgi:hypothetical protein